MFESFIEKIALQLVGVMRRELLAYLAKAFRDEFRVSLNTFDNRVNTMYDNLEQVTKVLDKLLENLEQMRKDLDKLLEIVQAR